MTDMSLSPDEPTKRSKWRSPKRIAAIAAFSIVAIIALGYGAIFFYANVLNDAPDELGASDLEAVFATTTVADPPPGTADPADDTGHRRWVGQRFRRARYRRGAGPVRSSACASMSNCQ